jgi:hypothetical protein
MLATNDESRKVLLRALTDRRNSYRMGMRPTDIIAQSRAGRHNEKPSFLAGLAQRLVRVEAKSQWRLRHIFE